MFDYNNYDGIDKKALQDTDPPSHGLGALLLGIALLFASSFLYALIFKDVWNWFLAPAIPVLPQLSYGVAYGVVFAIHAIVMIIEEPRDDTKTKSDFAKEFPIIYRLLVTGVKVTFMLGVWGFAGIAHAIIG